MLIVDAKNGAHMLKYEYQLNSYLPLVREGDTRVKFESEGHIYTNENGINIPSFSEIMDFVQKTYKDDAVIEGMKRGGYIHRAIAMLNSGKTIDISGLIEDAQGPVVGWIKFLNENRLKSYRFIVEQPYISKLGYTGTPDLICPDYPGKDQLWLIYLKDDGTYKKQVVSIDKAKFNEFRCAIATFNLSKKL